MIETYSLFQTALILVASAILVVIGVIDTKTRRIPDTLNLALLLCGVAAIWAFPETDIFSRCVGLFAVSLPLFLFALFIRDSFGMGDVKLMAAAGFLLGWRHALAAFVIGVLIGGIYGVILLISRRRSAKEHFAFGPCLAVGIITALTIGDAIIEYLALSA
jgi:leader peptidase (prepilin peptidase)/N-methyltransferase